MKIVSHDQRGKETVYDYPSRVFPVDCTQEAVGQEVLPGLLEDFWSERNAMLFAYGQTGTGKTTTMFGFPDSLTSESEDPGWGLLPRAVHATLAHNAAQAQRGVHSVLLLSAVEFYAYAAARPAAVRPRDCRLRSVASCGSFMAFDLADVAGKQMCTMKGHQVLGNTYTQCDSPAILRGFIERVYGNRKVVATRMNEGSVRGQPSKGTHLPSVQSWDARLACPQLGRTCASDPGAPSAPPRAPMGFPWVDRSRWGHPPQQADSDRPPVPRPAQSRSHCAIILTLLTLDASSGRFRQTHFTIVDLAGAERPEKVREPSPSSPMTFHGLP